MAAVCIELTGRFGLGAAEHLHPVASESGVLLVPIDRSTISLVWSEQRLPRERGLPRLPPPHRPSPQPLEQRRARLRPRGSRWRSRASTQAISSRASLVRLRGAEGRSPPAPSSRRRYSCARSTPSCSGTGGRRASVAAGGRGGAQPAGARAGPPGRRARAARAGCQRGGRARSAGRRAGWGSGGGPFDLVGSQGRRDVLRGARGASWDVVPGGGRARKRHGCARAARAPGQRLAVHGLARDRCAVRARALRGVIARRLALALAADGARRGAGRPSAISPPTPIASCLLGPVVALAR